MDGDPTAAVDRVLTALGAPDALETLSASVSGADLTSFLLEVTRRRAAAVTPADVVRRLASDRFVEPGRVAARALHRTTVTVIDAIPDAFELLELAPVSPLGTHSSVATVHQHKVVSTIRGNEVAADPTNVLAALAAARRREPAPPGTNRTIRLGAVQRVLRAQPMGDAGQSHFSVLGLVTAGRDRGNLEFERGALVEQLSVLTTAVAAVTSAEITVEITSLRDRFTEALISAVRTALPDIEVLADPDRTHGRGYYRDLCCKVHVRTDAGAIEIGDGGFTDWTQRFTGDRKERLFISGLGLDRLSTVARH